ncbi:MAG TPA: WYL domain-containing protein, partial [Ktedonobacterales bacterium]|nr:WYL domain-containing protein [Ktedonobacterales bacterium]
IRTFRLDRIRAAALCTGENATFARPASFDCLTYAIQAFAAWPDAWRIEALIDAPLETVYMRAPAAFATLEETSEGVILRAYENDLDHAARFLIGLGLPFTVRQPPELFAALQRLAEVINAALLREEAVGVSRARRSGDPS